MSKQLQVPKSVFDLCVARDTALNMMQQSQDLLTRAECDLNACGSQLFPGNAKSKYSMRELTRTLDRRLWRQAFDKTGFMQLLDQQAKDKFENDVEKNPPPFTEANIQETFLTLAQSAEEMFQRGLINVFRGLSKDHKTNTSSPFKVNRKAILNSIVKVTTNRRLTVDSHASGPGTLNDIDRVIKLLDGCKHEPRALENAVNASFSKGEPYEDPYFHIKAYQRGSMHITFLREDLLLKANDLIHEYYKGRALAA